MKHQRITENGEIIFEFPTDRNVDYFKKLLAENPGLPRPSNRWELQEQGYAFDSVVFERKSANRAYDIARMELGLKTPREIQEECAWLTFPKNFEPQIIYHVSQTKI